MLEVQVIKENIPCTHCSDKTCSGGFTLSKNVLYIEAITTYLSMNLQMMTRLTQMFVNKLLLIH